MLKITDDEFKLLSKYIKEHSGINLKEEKKALLVGRLSNMLINLGFDSFMRYYQFLRNDKEGKELSRLIDKVTTNHTYFMREAEHFTFFSTEVLPYLEENVKNKDLRIWCAASSTGEEPYTLAMLLDEYFSRSKATWNKKLLATDLSTTVLEIAKKGVYTNDKINSLPKIWALNYFDKLSDGSYKVKSSLQRQVIFRRFNLLENVFPFKKKFHVIYCRNVMIYFDNETKMNLINKMYNSLEYGGYLFIGHSESINREHTRLKYIKPAVYRKV